jgi:hypothetical protein
VRERATDVGAVAVAVLKVVGVERRRVRVDEDDVGVVADCK